MKQVMHNSTIECMGAKIIYRKAVPSAYVDYENIGRCYTWKCYRNSEAEIVRELNPRISLLHRRSMLQEGDRLECENMFVAINRQRPYPPALVNHSGRHKASTFETTVFTLAKITKMIVGIPYTEIDNSLKGSLE